ncbi:hypothetical protein GS462_26535 [Rhodococcus hoagii]|nr:hypothetical protein [Prescottella equi]
MSTRDELAREELVAELRNANLTTHLFITPDGAADARRATDAEAAEQAADWVLGMFDHLAGVLGYSRPRVVETIDQLASLPDGTAIHNANGTLGELSTVGGVRVAFWAGNECEDELIEPWIGLPATVLYLPEETP